MIITSGLFLMPQQMYKKGSNSPKYSNLKDDLFVRIASYTSPKHPTSQHRNIIRPGLSASEGFEVVEEFGVELFGAFVGVFAQEIQQFFFPEFFAGGIAHFGEAVGVGENKRFFGEAEPAELEEGQLGEPAEGGAAVFEQNSLSIGEQDGRRVACVHVVQGPGTGVVLGQEKRDEFVALGYVIHRCVEFLDGFFERGAAGNQGPEIGLEIGHEQGRCHAFACNVGNAEGDLPVGEFHHVVIIPAHGKVGLVDARQLVVFARGKPPGYQGALDFSGHLYLAVYDFLAHPLLEQALVLDGHGNHIGDGGHELHLVIDIVVVLKTADEGVGNRLVFVQHRNHQVELPDEGVFRFFQPLGGAVPVQFGADIAFQQFLVDAQVGLALPMTAVAQKKAHLAQFHLPAQESVVHVEQVGGRNVIVDGLCDGQQTVDLQLLEADIPLQFFDARQGPFYFVQFGHEPYVDKK